MRLKTYYGLPRKVIFCKKSLISNQRPSSSVEFKHKANSKKTTLNIDKNGLSDSWKYSRAKKRIDFEKREKELIELLDKHRGKHGQYDCIVPGSGGKDSSYASHILKFKYGMNPLTVTWPPILYTKYGYQNYLNWLSTGSLDNVTPERDEYTMKYLTKLSIENLLHPFQTFILGQKNFVIKVALQRKIPLIFFGENEAEHGNPIADNKNSLRSKSYYTYNNINDLYLGGVRVKDIEKYSKYKISKEQIKTFLPADEKEFNNSEIEVRYLGYYLNWIPQECYYYSVKHAGFRPRPFRTQGTYSKYNSIDDKIDDLHYYTTYIKFGIGRATYDVSQEIRNEHLDTEEGKKLIAKYDGEFPNFYINEVLNYVGIKKTKFNNLIDNFRSPHLWKKTKSGWKLRHNVNKNGTDD